MIIPRPIARAKLADGKSLAGGMVTPLLGSPIAHRYGLGVLENAHKLVVADHCRPIKRKPRRQESGSVEIELGDLLFDLVGAAGNLDDGCAKFAGTNAVAGNVRVITNMGAPSTWRMEMLP